MDRDELLREIQEKTELSYSRSGGPGGQNVNKRDTRVTARLLVESLISPGDGGRMRIHRRLSGRINSEGYIVLHADGERSQLRNREEAVSRMEALVAGALRPDPRPRKPTRPSRAAKERRLGLKKLKGRIKDGRRGVSSSDN